MISVIFIEDNDDLRDDAVWSLNAEGLHARGASDGKNFDLLYQEEPPDVVIIDRMLPGEDGLSIAQRIGQLNSGKRIGIVFLTALGSLEDRIKGLDVADAYMTKPFNVPELAAVIRSIYRRLNFIQSENQEGTWRLSRRRLKLISPQGKFAEFSYSEVSLLALLANANGKPVSTRLIVEMLGQDWLSYEKNRLELALSRIRNRIRGLETLHYNPIKSVRNEGYLMTISVTLID